MARRGSGRRARWAAAALVTAVALTGCSAGDDDPAPEAAAEQGSAQDDRAEGGRDGGGDSGAGVEDVDLEDVLVEQTVAQPDDPDDRATIGVRSLTVEGDVMVLELVVTPDWASVSDSETVSLYDIWQLPQGTFRPTLLDRENLKRYAPISGGPGQTFTTDSVRTASLNGQPMRAFAVYAAPEDDIDTVDVVLADLWPAFTDVPVER